jgi:predicted nucleic acid-binding protein
VTVVVVDASVAVAWFLPEAGSDTARRLAASRVLLIAPDFLLLEIGSALTREAIRGHVPPGFAGQALRSLRKRHEIALRPADGLAEAAAALAERFSHAIYGCLYLALAQQDGAALATFDQRLAAIAERLAIPLWAADAAA